MSTSTRESGGEREMEDVERDRAMSSVNHSQLEQFGSSVKPCGTMK